MWRIVATGTDNIALACPSPSSISTAPSRIATPCFRWCCGSSAAALESAAARGRAPAAIRYLFDRDRAALKQSLLRATLRGTSRGELAAASTEFVRDTIERRCYRDALTAIRRHRDAGHYLVLMSASVDFYVPEFGRQLDFDHVISTGVAWNGEYLDGTLTTPNRRGAEKAVPARPGRRTPRRRNLCLRQQRFGPPAPGDRQARFAGQRLRRGTSRRGRPGNPHRRLVLGGLLGPL